MRRLAARRPPNRPRRQAHATGAQPLSGNLWRLSWMRARGLSYLGITPLVSELGPAREWAAFGFPHLLDMLPVRYKPRPARIFRWLSARHPSAIGPGAMGEHICTMLAVCHGRASPISTASWYTLPLSYLRLLLVWGHGLRTKAAADRRWYALYMAVDLRHWLALRFRRLEGAP